MLARRGRFAEVLDGLLLVLLAKEPQPLAENTGVVVCEQCVEHTIAIAACDVGHIAIVRTIPVDV
jgi:hypothetical protein